MKTPALFREYIWLVNTIWRAGKISLAEINEKWLETEMSEGVDIARATFNRHKDAIEDIFGLVIECDRKSGNRYYIENARVLREDSVQNWMLSTLSVNNIIADSMSLKDRILLQSVPCDDYLDMVIEAMKKKVRIAIKYRKYNSDLISEVNFEPYCLKLFNQRWYILAHFFRAATKEKEGSDYFCVYSFDRIEEMEITDIKFEVDSDFDALEYFSECYGVFAGDGIPAEEIVLRAKNDLRFYMRDLPLHHSQKLIGEGMDYADFKYYMKPSPDLLGYILNWGSNVEVLKPQSMRDKLHQMALDIAKMYER